MNDCLFEPSYSTFTISLLARPRCPTGGYKDLLCALSILALSKPIVLIRCGRTRTCEMLVLETSAVATVPRTYKKTGMGVEPTTTGFADQPPSHSGFPPSFYGWMENRTPATLITQDNFQDCYPCQLGVPNQICIPSISSNHPVH